MLSWDAWPLKLAGYQEVLAKVVDQEMQSIPPTAGQQGLGMQPKMLSLPFQDAPTQPLTAPLSYERETGPGAA